MWFVTLKCYDYPVFLCRIRINTLNKILKSYKIYYI
jgi:hypothetical protein